MHRLFLPLCWPLLAGTLFLTGCANEQPASRGMARLDTNRDGYVSQGEAASMPVLARNYARVDLNRDGRISENELLQAQEARSSRRAQGGNAAMSSSAVPTGASPRMSPTGPTSAATASSGGRTGQGFAQMDANGNGVLTRDEVSGRFAEKFDQVDLNSDSFVTLEEVQLAMQQRGSRRGASSGRQSGSTASMPSQEELYIDEQDLAVENYETTLVAPDGTAGPSSAPPPQDMSLRVDEEGYFVPGN